MNVGGVDDYVIAEPDGGAPRFFRTRWKDVLIVPLPVRLLAEPHVEALNIDVTEKNSSIEEIAHVVAYAYRSARDEQRIFLVADLDGVDRHPAEQASRDSSNVERSVSFSRDPCLHVSADLVLTVVRLSHGHDEPGDHDEQRDQRQRAP